MDSLEYGTRVILFSNLNYVLNLYFILYLCSQVHMFQVCRLEIKYLPSDDPNLKIAWLKDDKVSLLIHQNLFLGFRNRSSNRIVRVLTHPLLLLILSEFPISGLFTSN